MERFAARLDEMQERLEAREMGFVPSELIDITAESTEPAYKVVKTRPKVKVELTDKGIEDRTKPSAKQGQLLSVRRNRKEGTITKITEVKESNAESNEDDASVRVDDMVQNMQYAMKHNVPRLF